VTGWGDFVLSGATPGSGTDSATLTVLDPSGSPVPGYANLAIPANGVVDLSGMSATASGQSPSFRVAYSGLTAQTLHASVQAVGGAPQLCVSPVLRYPCPTGAQVITSLADQPGTVTASGTTTPAGGSATTLPSDSTTVTTLAPSIADCSGVLAGAALDVAKRPVQGATVALLDGTGTPVLSGGSPVTTTTGIDGTYHFASLAAGSYAISFADLNGQTKVESATAVTGGSGTTSASGGVVVSPTVTVAVSAKAVVNATYDLHPAAVPDVSAGRVNTPQVIEPLANDAPSDTATFDATTGQVVVGVRKTLGGDGGHVEEAGADGAGLREAARSHGLRMGHEVLDLPTGAHGVLEG